MNEQTPVTEPTLELPLEAYAHLARRYGADAQEVVAIAAADMRLAQPIVAGLPDLLAEAVFAARHGQARTVADVLLRRTRVGVLAPDETCDAAGAVARRVAIAMAEELGWSSERALAEAEAYLTRARAALR